MLRDSPSRTENIVYFESLSSSFTMTCTLCEFEIYLFSPLPIKYRDWVIEITLPYQCAWLCVDPCGSWCVFMGGVCVDACMCAHMHVCVRARGMHAYMSLVGYMHMPVDLVAEWNYLACQPAKRLTITRIVVYLPEKKNL